MKLKEMLGWIETRGKIWLFRVLTWLLLTWSSVKELGIFGQPSSQQTLVILTLPTILLLMMEIFLTTIAKLQEEQSVGKQLTTWDNVISDVQDKARRSKRIDILTSSSESLYVALKDTLEACHDKEVRILLREWEDFTINRYYKLQNYESNWLALNNFNSNLKVSIRYCRNDTLRAIIFDDNEGFVGFYTWQKSIYRAQNVPVIHVKANESTFSKHLLQVYRNRFDHYWETSTRLPTLPEGGLSGVAPLSSNSDLPN